MTTQLPEIPADAATTAPARPPWWAALRLVLFAMAWAILLRDAIVYSFGHLARGFADLRAGGFATTDALSFAADLCAPVGFVGAGVLVIYFVVRTLIGKPMSNRTGWIAIGGFVGLEALALALRFAAGGVTRAALTSPGSLMLIGGVAAIAGGYWLAERYWIKPRK